MTHRRCTDCLGSGQTRRWSDILNEYAELIRCPICLGEGSISEAETASKLRPAEIRRHEARNAAEQARKDVEEQTAFLDLQKQIASFLAAEIPPDTHPYRTECDCPKCVLHAQQLTALRRAEERVSISATEVSAEPTTVEEAQVELTVEVEPAVAQLRRWLQKRLGITPRQRRR